VHKRLVIQSHELRKEAFSPLLEKSQHIWRKVVAIPDFSFLVVDRYCTHSLCRIGNFFIHCISLEIINKIIIYFKEVLDRCGVIFMVIRLDPNPIRCTKWEEPWGLGVILRKWDLWHIPLEHVLSSDVCQSVCFPLLKNTLERERY
jgi:hypothetical protein